VTASASEPSKAYWAIGIAASLSLHAGLVGGAALLAGRYAQASAPTEITFSNEASPTAEAVPATAAPATPSEVASAVAAERAEPSSPSETAAEKAETVQPAEAIVATEAEPAAISEDAEAAAALQNTEAAAAAESAERAEVSSSQDAAAAVSGETAETLTAQEQPAAAAAAERTPPETTVGEAAAESAPPVAAQDIATAGGDQTEQVVALQTPETVVAAPVSGDQPAAATAPETAQPPATSSAEVASASSAAEAAQPQAPATGNSAVASTGGAETASPTASTAETVAATEAVQAPATGNVAVATPSGAETASPAASTAETVAATEAVQPSGGTGSAGSDAAIVPGGQETAEPVRPLETALLVPARPNSVLGTEVDKPTDRYRRIVDFIRGYQGGDCFIALPAMDLEGTVTFQTFGRDKAREDQFREALRAIDELKTEISSGDVADPQCLALGFAQTARRYPGFSLVIDLDETEMASGTRLSGKVLNTTGRDLHLLLVDDEGTVQSMDSFLSAEDGGDRSFSVPLTLTGGPVATKQILMAIATDPPIWGLDKVKEPAADFFRELAGQVEASRADLDLAVEGFNVR